MNLHSLRRSVPPDESPPADNVRYPVSPVSDHSHRLDALAHALLLGPIAGILLTAALAYDFSSGTIA